MFSLRVKLYLGSSNVIRYFNTKNNKINFFIFKQFQKNVKYFLSLSLPIANTYQNVKLNNFGSNFLDFIV